MTWMPWAILSGLALEAVNAWIERTAVHVFEYQLIPHFWVWQHGTMSVEFDSRIQRERFFMLKLPSWKLIPSDFGRGPMVWAQLTLVWTSTDGWAHSDYYPE